MIKLGPSIRTSFVDRSQECQENAPARISIESQRDHSRNDLKAFKSHQIPETEALRKTGLKSKKMLHTQYQSSKWVGKDMNQLGIKNTELRKLVKREPAYVIKANKHIRVSSAPFHIYR